MPDYDNTNTFALFPNKDKKEDKDRDFGGTINIDGKEYWLNGYNRSKGIIGGYVKEKTDRKDDMWPTKQEVPVLGTVEPDGTIQYDDPINLDNIPF